MKKIPTLFKRIYENHKVVDILPEVTKGFEWVLKGEGTATVKYDGSCCAIIDGKLYKRYDAIGSLELCLEKFKKTGNTEYLLDVANYAMFRYMYPLPGEYFKATDSNESAGTVGTPINMER